MTADSVAAYRHVRNGSRACIAWFGGIHEGFPTPDFLTSYPGLGFDGLFFTDSRADWYMAGLAGIAPDFPASVDWLRGLIGAHGYERVFLSGQSSGGYAALRFGYYLRPTAINAFSPQTRNVTSEAGQTLPWVPVEDLGSLYAGWDAGFPIYIQVARSEDQHKAQNFWDDWEQIRPFLALDNVTVIRHPYDMHAVSLPLYGAGLFYKTLLSVPLLHSPMPG